MIDSYRRHQTIRNLVVASLLAILCIFTLGPLIVVTVAAFGSAPFILVPPPGWSLRWFEAVLSDRLWLDSAMVSLRAAFFVTILSSLIGLTASIALHGGNVRGRDTIVAIITSPLTLPGIILGLALLIMFGNLGILRSQWALILGHTIVTMPYVVRIMLAALNRDMRTLEEAAGTLGCTHAGTLWYVTLPLLRPSLFASAIIVFVLSFDNFNISVYLSAPGMTTLPVRIYQHLEYSGTPEVAAISAIIIFVGVALAIAVDRTVGAATLFGDKKHGFG